MPEDEISWPASTESIRSLGVARWRLSVHDDSVLEVIGEAADGSAIGRTRATLRQSRDAEGLRSSLEVGAGELEIREEGTVAVGAPIEDGVLLASFVDRIGAEQRTNEDPRPLAGSLRPRAIPLVGATSRLLATCRAARGEAAFWSAARAALACTSPAGGHLRGDRGAYPFDSAIVRSGAFEATEEHCAKATRAIATIPARGDASGCADGEPRPATLVGWQDGLLRRLCLAGVAAASGLAGGLTYWVCTGGAVVASGAGCTVVAPGVGTVGCGAAGGTIAQPVCASGGLAVAAGAAAAGLEACNVVASSSTVAALDSLEEYARRIPGTYPCQRSFEPERCELQAPPPGWRGPFHRLSTPASAFLEKCAAETCELWGSGYRGGFPCAQAYRGPLPAGQAGFEFYTEAEPRGGGELQRWCALEDMPDPLIHREDTHGAIRIAITKAQN